MYKLLKKLAFSISFLLMVMMPSSQTFAQNLDILGKTTAEEVREQHRIFDIYTKRYSPNAESINYLSEIQDSVQIYVLFGTWCHDSKKQVPAFMKTIELADNSAIKIHYIGVSKKKTDPKNLSTRWDLKYTPTFIIYRKGKEFGRIIEKPEISLEEDLVRILHSEPVLEN